jgi:hypothetical protein
VIAFGAGEDRTERKVSNGEINRELTTLKRILNLARQNGKLTHVPLIPMLKERNVRTGFFERDEITRIVAHLPTAIRRKMKGRRITTFLKAFRAACTKAGVRVGFRPTCGGPPSATWCAPASLSAWPCR